MRPDFEGGDTGIDLVAAEREGGYCAIQCKCYAPGTRMSKSHLDSLISASAREPFTARIVVYTRRLVGADRSKDRCGTDARVFRPSFRRSCEPANRLARSAPR